MKVYEGGCHCGNLRVAFRTALDPAQMAPRACQCAFCRKHATGAVSDPDGHLEFILKNPDQVHLYRFGLGITEFVICRNCGVYAGAHMPDGEAAIGNVMAHVLDAHAQFTLPTIPVVRSGEDENGRRIRRRKSWTPSTLVTGSA
jgi:hypothetical protein